jgi:hypothetical protein
MKNKAFLPIFFLSLFILNSCEDKKSDKQDPLVGTWEAVSMSVTLDDGTFFSVPITEDFSMILEIREDGTFTMTQTDEGETDVSSGTWSADNDRITIADQSGTSTSGTSTFDYDLDGDTLTFSITEFDDDLGGSILVTIEFRRI